MIDSAIFIDRDGIINKDVGPIKSFDEIIFNSDYIKLLQRLEKKSIPKFIITNQAIIARGICSENEIKNLHKELTNTLDREFGIKIIDIFYCPHHPNATIEKYKVYCNCRKPGPGLLIKCSEKYDIKLSRSVIIGDRLTDIYAGFLAGCKTVLTNYDDKSKEIESFINIDKQFVKPDLSSNNITKIYNYIINNKL